MRLDDLAKQGEGARGVGPVTATRRASCMRLDDLA